MVMQVPGRSIRSGNFHRGRQDVFSSMPSSLGLLRGNEGVFKEGFAVHILYCFPLKLLIDFLLRLPLFLTSAEPISPSALLCQLGPLMFRR